MSMKPQLHYTVPEETARVARAIFPKGNLYICMYDTFGLLFQDQDFAAHFSAEGQPSLRNLSSRQTKSILDACH